MVRALHTHTTHSLCLRCEIQYEAQTVAGKDTLIITAAKRQQFFGAPRASKNPHQESRQSTTSSLHHRSILLHPDLESFSLPQIKVKFTALPHTSISSCRSEAKPRRSSSSKKVSTSRFQPHRLLGTHKTDSLPDCYLACLPRRVQPWLMRYLPIYRNRHFSGQGPDRFQHQCLPRRPGYDKVDSRSLWR